MNAVLLAVGWLGSAAVPAPQNADSVMARAEAAYRTLRSLKAEFSQEIVNPMLGGPERSGGLLFLAPPNGFAMRFNDPAGDRIVADGTWLWLYTPSTVPGQVIRQAVPKGGATSPNLFGQFVENPAARFRSTYVKADTVEAEVVDVVRLVPFAEDAGYREAVVSVSRRDGLVRRIVLTESTGQRRTLIFRKISPDAPVPREEIQFRVPRGVRIVSP